MDAFDHCAALVRTADKDRYLATLFAPAARRGPLFALYAFNAELVRVRDLISEPMPGEIRLQWWHDLLHDPHGQNAGAGPVAAALLETIARFDLPVKPLIDLIEARRFDLYDEPMATLDELERYAIATSSSVIECATRLLGDSHSGTAPSARAAGISYALTGLLRAFPVHASRRQLFVPSEVLTRHGANAEDVFAGRSTLAVRAALSEMRGLARQNFEEYRAAVRMRPSDTGPAFLPLALVPLYLARLERGDPFALTEVPQWRRQWALWRAARRA